MYLSDLLVSSQDFSFHLLGIYSLWFFLDCVFDMIFFIYSMPMMIVKYT
jgi:hypothetical protein